MPPCQAAEPVRVIFIADPPRSRAEPSNSATGAGTQVSSRVVIGLSSSAVAPGERSARRGRFPFDKGGDHAAWFFPDGCSRDAGGLMVPGAGGPRGRGGIGGGRCNRGGGPPTDQ